jgi:hypothetical protein
MYDRLGLLCYPHGARNASDVVLVFLLLMYNEVFNESPDKYEPRSLAIHGLHKNSSVDCLVLLCFV